ncbi:MAG: hypothetical protein CL503_06790 [Actinobacteria bacterium]|nr:hypothetical protein [Actinomycetota bacterium]|tara:strand:+ start:296 stop:892 length:597 start_codon:yes stop_codon:yes gene_type:complete
MKQKEIKKEIQSEKQILNTIYTIIKIETLSKEKAIDILIVLKGSLQKTNKPIDLSLLLKIYTLLVKVIPHTQEINNLLFINFYALFNYLSENNQTKNTNIRKYLLLIEYYLMQHNNTILKEQIELLLYIIQELIQKKITIFSFQYGFLYLKIYDLIQSKKLTAYFKKELYQTKDMILSICPETEVGKELIQLMLTKTN